MPNSVAASEAMPRNTSISRPATRKSSTRSIYFRIARPAAIVTSRYRPTMLPSIGQLKAVALTRSGIWLEPKRKSAAASGQCNAWAAIRRDSDLDALPGIVPKAKYQQDAADHDIEHHCIPGTDNAQVCAVNRPAQEWQIHFATSEVIGERNAKEHDSQQVQGQGPSRVTRP